MNANVYVGHYEARATPIADTNPATPGPNRDNVARFVPDDSGRFPSPRPSHRNQLVANAPGVRPRSVPGEQHAARRDPDRDDALRARTTRHRHNGAVASGDGINHHQLIDDTEGTQWEASGAPVQGRQVLIDLAGGAQTFTQVKASAHLTGQNRFTALRQFDSTRAPWARTKRTRPVVRLWRTGSADPPEPRRRVSRRHAAPGGAGADHAHVRGADHDGDACSVPRTGQPVTGNEHFQGEQDNDPANVTDCRIGTPPALPPRGNDVRAAELEVLSDRPRVDGANADE